MNQAFSSVVQIGVVVADAAQTVTNLERLLGWKPCCSRETMRIPGRTYHGAEEDFACIMYFYPFERIELEIIQPLCGRSCWSDFLRSRGNGIHHLLFDLTDSAPAIESLSRNGIEIEQRGRALPYGEHAFWAYVNSQEKLGFTVELTNRSEAPQPNMQSAPLRGPFSAVKGVSILVQNLEKSMQAYRSILNWQCQDNPYRVYTDRKRGKESSGLCGAIAYTLPNLDVELIRPALGSCYASEQLKDDGVGICCLNLETRGYEDVQRLTSQGISILEQGHTLVDHRVSRWVLFDTKAIFGFQTRLLFS